MSQYNCTRECADSYCQFVKDPQNPRRYVCLKCGLERYLDETEYSNPPTVLLILTTIVVTLLLL